MRINFNYEASSTHTAYLVNQREMNKSLLRLSTGMRILEASDDAAGLFIADQLSVVATGLEEGNRNIRTGISALKIAENAAGQIFERLRGIYSRAVRAANDINDPNARASLQQEISNLRDAIQKIGTDTEYNGIKLLDGTFKDKYIHYGSRMNQTILVSVGDVRAQSLGAHMVSGNGRVETSGANQTIANLETDRDNFALANNEYLRVAGQNALEGTATTVLVDAATAARNINNNATLSAMGIEATASNRSVANTYSSLIEFSDATTTGTLTLRFYIGAQSVTSASFSLTNITASTTLNDLVTQINSAASAANSPISARADNGKLVLETSNGETIAIEAEVTFSGATAATVNFSQLIQGAGNVSGLTSTQRAYAIKVGSLNIAGTDSFVVNENGIDIVGTPVADPSINSTFTNLYAIDVTSNAGAERALLITKKAMQYVDRLRSNIGAVMNNLQSIFDAQKVGYDNTKEAENVIRNIDYAEEMTNFTKLQIRMQSTMAMLAQANQMPQLVLQLLR
ncbi:flagellin N-terminal helical domain-containing protein [Thermocrinis sp.]